MVIVNKRTVADNMEKKFRSAIKKTTRDKVNLPVIYRNGVIVKIPLEIVLMRAAFSKIQLNIIVTVLNTIGNKIDEIINKKVKERDILSLFSNEELGEDENNIKFIIKRKEFGIPASHIEELKGALRLMRIIPVDLPITGKVTGTEYTKYTNLCSVILPNDDLKDYCIVEMSRDVALHILHEDLRYANSVDNISRKLRAKYSRRIYWIVMLYAYNGGVTFSFEDFKILICGTENKYDRYPRFEEEVLRKSKKDIDDLYLKGLCEYCFEYYPTKEDRKKSKERGNPDTLIFTITKNHRLEPYTDKCVFQKDIKEIEAILVNDLSITPKRAAKFIEEVNEDNIESFRNKILKLKEFKAADPSKKSGYFATSIINFFEEHKSVKTGNKEDTYESEQSKEIEIKDENPEQYDQ